MLDPPAIVYTVIEIAYTLNGDPHAQWESMQKLMNKKKFDNMSKLDPNSINDISFFEAKILFENAQQLSKEKIGEPAQAILTWEEAMIAVYDETKKALTVTNDIEKLKDELFALMQKLNKQKKDAEILKIEKDKSLKHSNSLVSKCYNLHELYQQIAIPNGDWKGIDEWKAKLVKVKERQKNIVGDMLIMAGILTFFGPFTGNSRDKIKKEWMKILNQLNIYTSENPLASLLVGTPNQMADLHLKGLLNDELCSENALIMLHSNRWPLVIDPEGAAHRWLGARKKIKATSPHAYDDLIKEIAQGGEIVLDDIPEALDENIVELLEIPKKRPASGKFKLREGKELDVALSFGFTLRTTHWNPIFTDDLWYTANIVNFGLRPKAIQDLFGVEYGSCSASSEITDIILQKDDPMVLNHNDKENVLLTQMTLINLERIDEEDQKSIKDKINDTLKILLELEKRMAENKNVSQKENTEKLSSVIPLCIRAQIIYRCVSTLTMVKPTYLFNFEYIKEQFNSMLRLYLSDYTKWVSLLTTNIMTTLERSMMHYDYLIFAFYLAAGISIEAKEISTEEWLVFLYGSDYIPARSCFNKLKNPNSLKISEKEWNLLSYLDGIGEQNSPFKNLCQDIIAHFSEWELWFSDKNPYLAHLPGLHQKAFSKPFQRILLIRLLSPEKVTESRELCASAVIGDSYLKVKHLTIPEAYAECRVNKPLLIIKEETDDPTLQVLKLDDGNTKGDTFTLTNDTELSIKTAIDNGKRISDKPEPKFIFVRDIHTVPEFAHFLTEKIKEFSTPSNELNEKFRLILSCNPCELPRFILQNTLRLSYQSTKKMKETVKNDLLAFQHQEAIASSVPTNKEKYTPQYRRLALSLSILHAVVEKRNVFGKSAWNRTFKITKGEIDAANRMIFYILDGFREPIPPATHAQTTPWDDMRRLLEEICLGGKVIEEFDQKTLGCLIDMYINEDAAIGNYAFKENSGYKIPSLGTFPELLNFVDNLPDGDDYGICNMSTEVTLVGQRAETEKMLLGIQIIDPRKNFHPQEELKVSNEMQRVEDAINKIMQEIPEQGLLKEDINPVITELKKGVLYGHHIFLLQEMNRYNSLIQKIFDTLEKIKGHINKGTLMPQALEKTYYTLAELKVPEEFIGYKWQFSLPGWIISFKKNIEYIREWLKAGETNGYWLRAILYPQGLINSLLLYYSQKYEQNVERLWFASEFTTYNEMSEISDNDPQVSYLYDTYMINAKLNPETSILEEFTDEECKKFSGQNKYWRLPVIALRPNIEQKEEQIGYECPLHYLPTRESKIGTMENMITKIDCPTDLKSQYWILKGVFISCHNPATIS